MFQFHKTWILFVTLSALPLLQNVTEAQLLSGIRSAVTSESESSPPKKEKKKKNRDRDRRRNRRDNDNDGNNFLGNLLSSMLFGTSTDSDRDETYFDQSDDDNDVNYQIYFEQQNEGSTPSSSSVSFAEYPYQADAGILNPGTGLSRSKNQFGFWYGTDFDNVDTWNTQFRFENSETLGFEFQWAHITEKLSGAPRDSLNLADFNVTMPLIESEFLIARWGAGLNLFTDRNTTRGDYNLTFSAEMFPTEPMIVSFEFDHGEIGTTHQTHLLSTIGANWNRGEIMTGYEYRKVGRIELHGPLLGIRLWW